MSRDQDLFGKTVYVDTLTTMLIFYMFVSIVSMSIEHAKKKQEDANLRTDGLYAIVMEWSDTSKDDVDLHVRDPAGNHAFYSARDVGLMHLEHDDQGSVSDRVRTETGEVTVARNEERLVLRGSIPGEYVINVHLFDMRDPGPIEVKIRLVRLKGETGDVKTLVRTLEHLGEERTAFRFRLDAGGVASDFNERERLFIGPQPGGQ